VYLIRMLVQKQCEGIIIIVVIIIVVVFVMCVVRFLLGGDVWDENELYR
jgi:hypothetical protein